MIHFLHDPNCLRFVVTFILKFDTSTCTSFSKTTMASSVILQDWYDRIYSECEEFLKEHVPEPLAKKMAEVYATTAAPALKQKLRESSNPNVEKEFNMTICRLATMSTFVKTRIEAEVSIGHPLRQDSEALFVFSRFIKSNIPHLSEDPKEWSDIAMEVFRGPAPIDPAIIHYVTADILDRKGIEHTPGFLDYIMHYSKTGPNHPQPRDLEAFIALTIEGVWEHGREAKSRHSPPQN